MASHYRWFVFIVFLAIFGIWVILPDTIITNIPDSCYAESETPPPQEGLHWDTNGDCTSDITLNVQQSLGLDLVGGLRVLLEAELPPDAFTIDDLREAANNVSRRVNALGLSEATVQVQGANRLLVEIPGLHDRQRAIDTIRQTALLEFVDFGGLRAQSQDYIGQRILTTEQMNLISRTEGEIDLSALRHPITGQPFETIMTGAGLQSAVAQFGPTRQGGNPEWFISFEVAPDFVNTFGAFTQSRRGEPMAIVLDGVVLSAPIIQDRLDTGGIISGSFTEESAKTLALQLRSGALPIPLKVVNGEEVGATLGQESVRLSISAGVIGVIIVLAFMLIYYRVPGLSASLALMMFIVINFMLFKLIPITLTLPAITGFLIGIGTAVDGNILIFERIKEELRSGSNLDDALKAGFERAWTSIRDSNFSTITIGVILFLFGQTPGATIVSGFAITLILGLLINLFTAVIVTRTFLYVIVHVLRAPISQRQWLFGV